MTTSPFTLAALASAAVEDRVYTRANLFTSGQIGDFDTALLEDESGEQLLIRIPTSQHASDDLEADLRGINAMSAGIRSRLPFGVTKAIGHVDHEPFDGLVVTYIDGVPIDLTGLEPHTGVADALGVAIASIHNLPTGFVDDYGLPNQPAGQVRDGLTNLIDRAAYDGDLPIPLVSRWNAAINEDDWWEFSSTVVHGDLSESLVLMQQGHVSGVLGWHSLAVGDPARDLGWCLTPVAQETADAITSAYTTRREGEADPFIARRAKFYGELSLVEWLLHGLEDNDQEIEQDARAMIDDLLRNVEQGTVADLLEPDVAQDDDADENRSIVVSMLHSASEGEANDANDRDGWNGDSEGSHDAATDVLADFVTNDLIDPADAVLSNLDNTLDDDSNEGNTGSLTGSHALLLTDVVEAEVVEDNEFGSVDDSADHEARNTIDDSEGQDDDVLVTEPISEDLQELPTEAFGNHPLSVIADAADTDDPEASQDTDHDDPGAASTNS